MASSLPKEHKAWIHGLGDDPFKVEWGGPIDGDGVKKLVLGAVPGLGSVIDFHLLKGDKESKLDARAAVSTEGTSTSSSSSSPSWVRVCFLGWATRAVKAREWRV